MSDARTLGMLRRQAGPEFFRYLGASLLALCLDALVLLLLARFMHYAFAAALAFMAGSLLHYLISVRFVFYRRRLEDRRWLESGLFFSVGLAGLLLNVAVIAACVEWLTAPLLIAKLGAAGFSFFVGYAGRKWLLFGQR